MVTSLLCPLSFSRQYIDPGGVMKRDYLRMVGPDIRLTPALIVTLWVQRLPSFQNPTVKWFTWFAGSGLMIFTKLACDRFLKYGLGDLSKLVLLTLTAPQGYILGHLPPKIFSSPVCTTNNFNCVKISPNLTISAYD